MAATAHPDELPHGCLTERLRAMAIKWNGRGRAAARYLSRPAGELRR
jgi:hypothetical protein